MSRARHKKHAAGGKVSWAGGNQNVIKEAHERKKGGRVHHHGEGEEAKHRSDRKERKHGGGVHHSGHPKHHADGGKAHHAHMHSAHAAKVPGRKRGGGIGANLTPLSTAARIKEVTKGESSEDMGKH